MGTREHAPVYQEAKKLMYRYCSGDGGWNERAFFQDKLATESGLDGACDASGRVSKERRGQRR